MIIHNKRNSILLFCLHLCEHITNRKRYVIDARTHVLCFLFFDWLETAEKHQNQTNVTTAAWWGRRRCRRRKRRPEKKTTDHKTANDAIQCMRNTISKIHGAKVHKKRRKKKERNASIVLHIYVHTNNKHFHYFPAFQFVLHTQDCQTL